MKFRECETQEERVALAESTPAEVIKTRLVEFLKWPTNGGPRMFFEWAEVVESLLDE